MAQKNTTSKIKNIQIFNDRISYLPDFVNNDLTLTVSELISKYGNADSVNKNNKNYYEYIYDKDDGIEVYRMKFYTRDGKVLRKYIATNDFNIYNSVILKLDFQQESNNEYFSVKTDELIYPKRNIGYVRPLLLQYSDGGVKFIIDYVSFDYVSESKSTEE